MVQNVRPRQPLLRVFGQQTFQETLKQRHIKSAKTHFFHHMTDQLSHFGFNCQTALCSATDYSKIAIYSATSLPKPSPFPVIRSHPNVQTATQDGS